MRICDRCESKEGALLVTLTLEAFDNSDDQGINDRLLSRDLCRKCREELTGELREFLIGGMVLPKGEDDE